MTKTLIRASMLALSIAAVPALAAEEYQRGPARAAVSAVTTRDVGSVQTPAADGAYALATPREQLVRRMNGSSTVQTVNSAPRGSLSETLDHSIVSAAVMRPAG